MKKSYAPRRQPTYSEIVKFWFESHYLTLFLYAKGLLNGSCVQGKDAADFVADLYILLESKPPINLNDMSKPLPYLMRSIRNAIFNARKRTIRYGEFIIHIKVTNDSVNTTQNMGQFMLLQDECYSLLRRALSKREFAVVSRLAEGYTYEEISDILSININTLRTLAMRGRRKAYTILRQNHLI